MKTQSIVVDTVVLHATVFDIGRVIERFSDPHSGVSVPPSIGMERWSAMLRSGRCMACGSVEKKRRTKVKLLDRDWLVNLNDGEDPFPEGQIHALGHLLKGIISRHPIRRIVTHYDAEPPTKIRSRRFQEAGQRLL
jgi:hypothetical protein